MNEGAWTVQDMHEGRAYLRNGEYVYALPRQYLPASVEPGEELFTDGVTLGGYFVFSPASPRSPETAAAADVH